jgi:hypothetical protein
MTPHVSPIKTQNNYIKKEKKRKPTYCAAPHLLRRPCTRRKRGPLAADLALARPPPARTLAAQPDLHPIHLL